MVTEKLKDFQKLLDKPNEFITTILIVNNVANIILPILVAILAIRKESILSLLL